MLAEIMGDFAGRAGAIIGNSGQIFSVRGFGLNGCFVAAAMIL